MPSYTDPTHPPLRTQEWFRVAVACVTNISILAAPCHGFSDFVALPDYSMGGDFMLAALLPERGDVVLDAHGGASTQAAGFFEWHTPERPAFWMSPEPAGVRPGDLLSTWESPAPESLPAPAVTPSTIQVPWIPGEVPSGSDPAPRQGNFGALPIEQESGDCVVFGEVASGLDPVPGARVEILGTGRIAETDAQGRFRIEGLPAGDFTADASALGYSGQTLGVSASPTTPAELRFNLTEKPVDGGNEEYMLEEESIVGEYQESSQGDLFINLETSQTITSGIDKAEFSQKNISDAAGAVGKISGANIVGGKFAVVRGLADRYVTTLFNGAAISSADPSRKAVQLDIFPTVALQGIDIAKTYVPSLPGDFGGGTIKIQSLSIPQERVAEFKYKMTWNSNLEDRMLVHPNRDLGFWGDATQAIPDNLLWNVDAFGNPVSFNSGGNRVTPNNNNRNQAQQAAQVAVGREQQAQADAALEGVRRLHQSQSFMPKVEKPEAGESFSLVYGDRVELENGGEFGFMAAFQRSSSDEVNAAGPENRLTSPARSWTEESYAREVDWSVYVGAGYRPNENHEFTATYFHKQISTDEITHGTDFQIQGSDVYGAFARNDAVINRYGASAVYNKEFWTIDPIVRDTEILQFGGSHKNDIGTKLAWGITRSTARESRPHSSTFQNGILDFTDPRIAAEAANNPDFVYNPSLGQISTIEYQTFVNDGNGSQDSARSTQFIDETSLESSIDLTQSIYFSQDKEDGPRLDFSFGGSSLSKDREQQGRVYLLKTASWERWVARNTPSWWPSDGSIAPYSPGMPLAATTMPDGSAIPGGFGTLGEYFAANPDALVDFFNGYGNEGIGRIPGTGTASNSANYVQPDAPYYVNGSGLEVRNVDSELALTGLYTSATFYADNWRFGGGGRWEKETKSYEVAADPLTRLLPDDPTRVGEVTTSAFIPSLLAGVDLIPDKSWMNFAWSRTVARPTFHEFLPIESIDQETGIIRRGNPTLGETSIDNLDLSLDYVFSDTFNARASLFHKTLTDPIVVVQRVDQGVNSNTYINGDSGSIDGFELEGVWRQKDGPFSVSGNYTYIDSTLKYQVNQGIQVTDLETRFPFQPSQILNLTLGWAPEDGPWSAFLTTNFTAEYPTILRSDPNAYDVWLNSQLTLDLVVARKFEFDQFDATLTFGVKNLLDGTLDYEYRGGGTNGSTGPYDGLVYTQDSPGRSFSLELKAQF
ncbi:carboxypeptidase regulatory-like domain-containing protein [Luteolibacter marinus]|uniref:carboxypeptidase regulatory-like domain-containing protein n=1 Tax=Luteolibacter marinus TaxID=2776705 RepID=UPI0018666966|nr:carboxypeptidase regulatory-like domain-containing protein [Luteolibacter marinus]